MSRKNPVPTIAVRVNTDVYELVRVLAFTDRVSLSDTMSELILLGLKVKETQGS